MQDMSAAAHNPKCNPPMKRTAIVTGAANGIGRAVATAFAANGYRVVIADNQAPWNTPAVGVGYRADAVDQTRDPSTSSG